MKEKPKQTLIARESRFAREHAHRRRKLLKTCFQCRSWKKERVVHRRLASTCLLFCLSLLEEKLFFVVVIVLCPPVVRCGAVRHCNVVQAPVGTLSVVRPYDVLWDTVVYAALCLCPRVSPAVLSCGRRN